jgi:hypothetical protein
VKLFTRNGTPSVNSVAVYVGPSRIDGQDIVVIVTGLRGSKNDKTGSMVQSYILRADRDPLEALRTGTDSTVCGGCPLRPQWSDGTRYGAKACYVNVGQAPLALWRAWKRGTIPIVTTGDLAELTRGRMVRLGSYGDPAAVPPVIWYAYTRYAAGWTGYTHQSRSPKLRDVLTWCQVSADSEADAVEARRAGVGSFRVLRDGDAPLPFETVCPASEEAGKVTTCADCRMCSGMNGASVVISAHGIGKGHIQADKRRPLSLPVINAHRSEVFA